MRQIRSMWALGLLALATSALAVRPDPAAAGAELHTHESLGWGKGGELPWFCHNLQCPRFTVVNATEDYEVRYYEAGAWASTDVEAYAFALAANTGFRRLFGYIEGQNEDAEKIPMTAPVRTKVSAAAGPFCKSNRLLPSCRYDPPSRLTGRHQEVWLVAKEEAHTQA